MNHIKKINIKTTGYINISAIFAAVLVHLLVTFQVIPYTYINGGRSISFAGARQTSILSIIILVSMVFVNFWALLSVKRYVIFLKILLWILFIYSVFGIIQQLMGTLFEKIGMSVVCLVNAIMYLRLALEKRESIENKDMKIEK
jgi:hypothetical protein